MNIIAFGTGSLRALFAAAVLMVVSGAAAAQQMCPPPYMQAASPLTGPVCTSTCAPGSFPALESGNVACKPGYATAVCPDGGEFMVMTPNGPICQQGYVPVAVANSFACNPGDLRVERPPYQLNGALAYETCVAGPACPPGYIETVDPDNALGTSKVCMLPCQDFVMNQSMACSCGSGGRLSAQQPGAPVQQICQPSCPAGMQWAASSPLYAFQAEEGQCMPVGGGQPVPLADIQPACPGATYWNGQVCLPVGGGAGIPLLIFGGCPPGKHWNGSHCVPNFVPPPLCPPKTHWNGLFCVPNAPKPCPLFQKWDGNKCVPIVQQGCPPNQFWNGNKCVPKFQFCPPPKKWINGQCVNALPPPPQPCLPPKKWVNGQCVLVLQQPCLPPKKWINGQCVNVLPPPPQPCLPPKKMVNGQCMLVLQQPCLPPKKIVNGQCVNVLPPPPQPCLPPKKVINGKCMLVLQPCLPPKKIINGKCQ